MRNPSISAPNFQPGFSFKAQASSTDSKWYDTPAIANSENSAFGIPPPPPPTHTHPHVA